MSRIRTNIAANFGGNAWSALMSLAFVPIYIRLMGMEAYGLIGVFITLRALFALLNMGLHSALNRGLARLEGQQDSGGNMRDLLRTLEIPYCAAGAVIGVSIAALAPLLANNWITSEDLSPSVLRTAIVLMGVATGLNWPLSFYSGGLKGLEHQVLLNVINSSMATLRGCGAVLVLWLISPTVLVFFSWQVVVSALHTILVGGFLWRKIPPAGRPARFRRDLLAENFAFAAGLTGTAVMTTVITQADKVVLSRMLSLEMFGFYMLANVIAVNLFRLVAPVVTATFPRMSSLLANNKSKELHHLYHKGAQFISVMLVPVAVTLAFFSHEILSILALWTQEPNLAQQTYLAMSLLVAAAAVRALTRIPHSLQLASGWTSLAFMVSVLSAVVIVPLLIVLTARWGPAGAALARLLVSIGGLLIGAEVMHRRLLLGEKWKWYAQDIGIPVLVAVLAAILIRALLPPVHDPLSVVALLAGAYGLIAAVTAAATPISRNWLHSKFFTLVSCNSLLR